MHKCNPQKWLEKYNAYNSNNNNQQNNHHQRSACIVSEKPFEPLLRSKDIMIFCRIKSPEINSQCSILCLCPCPCVYVCFDRYVKDDFVHVNGNLLCKSQRNEQLALANLTGISHKSSSLMSHLV